MLEINELYEESTTRSKPGINALDLESTTPPNLMLEINELYEESTTQYK